MPVRLTATLRILTMKIILIFSCIIALALANSELEQEEAKLDNTHDKCQSDPATYVDDEVLDDLPDHWDDPQVDAHLLCESIGVGLQDEHGELNYGFIEHIISLSVSNDDKVKGLLEECAVPMQKPGRTAAHLFVCLAKDNVTFFHEFNGHEHGHGHGCR